MKGLVTREEKNMVTVHIVRKEACGHCKACLSGYIEKDMNIEAKNLCDAEVGDWVELELQDNAFFKAIVVSYGIPFVGFLAALFLGHFFIEPLFVGSPEGLIAFLCGIAGVLLCYTWIRSQNKRWENGRYLPLAVRLAATEGFDD